MIITKLIGGLGNQMFQYAAAFTLAKHHNTELKMDNLFHLDTSPRSYRFEYRPYALDIFSLSGELATPNEIKHFVVPRTGNKYLYHLKKRIFPSKNVFTEFQIPDYQSLLTLPSEAYLEGYFQKYQYFSSVIDELKNEFVFLDPLPNNTLALLSKIQNESSVCVVFRRGDYVGHPTLDIIDLDYYYEAIDILFEVSNEKNLSLFVFSDDIPWCIEYFTPQKIKNICFVDQAYTGDKGKDYLQLMTHCKFFIIPNSTYPYWVAFLAKYKNRIVIAPKKWYRTQEIELNPIVPEDWITI